MKADKHTQVILLGILAGISIGAYLLRSHLTYRIGFPLDDAWIHQVYARQLIEHQEWAYFPGQPSAGSTSLLWTGILAVGYILNLMPYLWTFLIGWLLLWMIGYAGYLGFQRLCPSKPTWSFWAGALLVVEWHLVWAAVSGMETLLFALLALVVLVWMVGDQQQPGFRNAITWLGVGALIGVSVWVRPDGITLLGPAGFALYLGEQTWKRRISATIYLGVGFGLIIGLYLLFNYSLAGSLMPNTFYAKQTEYAALKRISTFERILEQAKLPLVGVGAVLLPGFGWMVWRSVQQRAWSAMAGVLWAVGYVFLYAFRLPATYQHGRYVMPMMPIYLLWSLAGFADWVKMDSSVRAIRIVSKAWMMLVLVLAVVFWGLGSRAYAWDVAIIESEMVTVARWVSENTEPDELIAAHDIGALGYFGERKLIDLAGIVSPEVIPIIRDERALGEYLDSQDADYLVTFPGWYPQLVARSELIFQTKGLFSPPLGGENMAVYRWGQP